MFKHFTKRKKVSLSKAELKKERVREIGCRVSAWLKKTDSDDRENKGEKGRE